MGGGVARCTKFGSYKRVEANWHRLELLGSRVGVVQSRATRGRRPLVQITPSPIAPKIETRARIPQDVRRVCRFGLPGAQADEAEGVCVGAIVG
jgi:hypothetical protein